MRGPQLTFIGRRRQGRIIRTVAEQGRWKGRRGKMTIEITKSAQLAIDGQVIEFHARMFSGPIAGLAGTVAEAIELLEQVYRERTQQHDPRLSKTRPVDIPGRRRGADNRDHTGQRKSKLRRTPPAPRGRGTKAPRRKEPAE